MGLLICSPCKKWCDVNHLSARCVCVGDPEGTKGRERAWWACARGAVSGACVRLEGWRWAHKMRGNHLVGRRVAVPAVRVAALATLWMRTPCVNALTVLHQSTKIVSFLFSKNCHFDPTRECPHRTAPVDTNRGSNREGGAASRTKRMSCTQSRRKACTLAGACRGS